MIKTSLKAILFAGALVGACDISARAEKKSTFTVAWSLYAGWMPWGYMADSGIMDKWAKKYGIDVNILQVNDYIESISQYTAGAIDGVSATNMDTLSIPAGGGLDTTALIVGDFSNGNDAILIKDKDLIKGKRGVATLKGKRVNLVELSVSHYLLARALDSVGLSERALTVINTSDADMVAAFTTPDVVAVVTWNPLVSTIMGMPDVTKIYSSSQIPGEIIDLMVVNTETLTDNPAFGKALVGAWYETMALMASDTPEGVAARTAMAESAGTDLAGYEAQLAATAMFYDPAKAAAFTRSEALKTTMVSIATFLFDHAILGESAPSADFIGVSYPDGTTTGDPGNVKFRYDTTYMDMAAKGTL